MQRPTIPVKERGARGSERAARRGRRRRVRRLLADLDARQILLGEQEVRLGRASDDGEERRHARDLLALLLQEPVQELLADEIALLSRDRREARNLLGHLLLLLERERDRLDGVSELRLRSRDSGDRDRSA